MQTLNPTHTPKEPITLDTRFVITPAGIAALDGAPPRRLTRKRRLVPALAAKHTRCIHSLSTPVR